MKSTGKEIPFSEVFKERFYMLRQMRDMSQAAFAQFLGIARPTVGFYENGKRFPDAETIQRICIRCGVSADWLLGLLPKDAMTTDGNIKSTCGFTGMSQQAVSVIVEDDTNTLVAGFNAIFDTTVISQFLSLAFGAFVRCNVAKEMHGETVKSCIDSGIPKDIDTVKEILQVKQMLDLDTFNFQKCAVQIIQEIQRKQLNLSLATVDQMAFEAQQMWKRIFSEAAVSDDE